MKAPQKDSGSHKLGIREVAKVIWNLAGKEAEDCPILLIDSEEARRALKPLSLKMAKQVVDVRLVPR